MLNCHWFPALSTKVCMVEYEVGTGELGYVPLAVAGPAVGMGTMVENHAEMAGQFS